MTSSEFAIVTALHVRENVASLFDSVAAPIDWYDKDKDGKCDNITKTHTQTHTLTIDDQSCI